MTDFKGFPKELPAFFQELSKHNTKLWFNGLHAGITMPIPKAFYSADIVDLAFEHYQNMLPLHKWLNKVVV